MGAAGNVIQQDTDVLRFTTLFMYLELEEKIRWAVTFHSVLTSKQEMPEILKTDCFTLDETLCEQRDSVPGQGTLVDEDLRGWHPYRGVGQESRSHGMLQGEESLQQPEELPP